jgi:MFS family permease
MPIGRPALALACAGFGYGTLAGFVVTRMHDGRIGGAGVALGVFGASFLAARWLGGHLVDRVPAARLLAVCAVGQALGLMSVAVASGAVIALLGVACAGAGTALVYPLLTLHASKAVSAEHRGTAVGALTSSWDVGLALAGPVGGAVAAPLGLSGPFVLGAAVALAAPLALRLRRPASVRPATRRRSPVST